MARGPLEQLHASFTADTKGHVHDSVLVDEADSCSYVYTHGVTEVRHEELVDGVGVREVADGRHEVGFHSSVAGEVVSRNLLVLYSKDNNSFFRHSKCELMRGLSRW